MLPLYFTQSKKFLELIHSGDKSNFLGSTPKLGKRIELFYLITIDVYACEEEPEIVPCKGLRMISWHVPKKIDVYENIKKPGWSGPFGKYIPIASPVPYIDAQDIKYYKKWSKRKQEYRNLWQRQLDSGKHLIVKTDIQTFLNEYLKSALSKKLMESNQEQMNKLFNIYQEKMLFYLVYDTKLDKAIAGVCILHDEELEQAIYQYCFSDKEYQYAGVGLVDWCVVYAQKYNLKFVNLTPIKTLIHGDKSWKGFTKFKLLFHPIVIYFRQSYIKFTYNK